MREIFLQSLKLEGDVAEIGLGTGENTLYFLQQASKVNKKVYGVDPFENDWDNMPESYGKPYRYKDFVKGIELFKDSFLLCKENSLTSKAEQFLNRPLCFAYVDGLQYKGAVLSDLRIVNHAEVICVDDYNRLSGISEVPLAVHKYIETSKRKLINLGRWAVLIK